MATTAEEKRKKVEEDRKAIKRYIFIGSTFTVLIFVIGIYCFPAGSESELPSYQDKLAYTLQWQIFSVLVLLFGVENVGAKRYSVPKAMDPVHGRGEDLIAFEKKFLQNTLEQLILSVLGQLIMSAYLSAAILTRVVPAIVLLFVVGRVLFYIGYKMDPLKRAVGFSMSFFPNVLMLLYCTVCFFVSKMRM